MKNISEQDLAENLTYYKRIFLLSEVGGMDPEEIVDNWEGNRPISVKAITRDLQALRQALESESLPEGYEESFHDIIGFRNQLRGSGMRQHGPVPPELEQRIEQRVLADLNKNRDLGFRADEIVEYFYRQWHTHFLMSKKS